MKRYSLIILGTLLIAASVLGVVLIQRQEFSPFDQPSDLNAVSGDDFLPLLAGLQAGTAPPADTFISTYGTFTTRSPALSPSDGSGVLSGQQNDEAPAALIPERIVIPKIGLDAPVVPTHYREVDYDGRTYRQWLVPDLFAAGWHDTSALLGQVGNTVLNGHHNAFGEVFRNLVFLNEGDEIVLYAGSVRFEYRVAAVMILPEKYQSLFTRLEHAQWMDPSADERITLVTCWPRNNNTHRLVVVAFPAVSAEDR